MHLTDPACHGPGSDNRATIVVASHVWKYVTGWIVVVCVIVIFALLGAKPGALIPAYLLATWLPMMVINFYEGRRLMGYLKEHHNERWAYLTSSFLGGPGGANSFRSLPFIYSADDLGDPCVGGLKRNYRRIVLLMGLMFVHYPVAVVGLGNLTSH